MSTATADAVTRFDQPPDECPRCHGGKTNRTAWWAYRLVPDAPCCGCGNCGFVIHLKAPPGWIERGSDHEGKLYEAVMVEGYQKDDKGRELTHLRKIFVSRKVARHA